MSLASTSVSAPSSVACRMRMRMQTSAMDDADFQNWIDEQMVPQRRPWRTPTTPFRGATAFLANCSSCHLIEGFNGDEDIAAAVVSQAAPNLTHFASRTTFAGGIPTPTPRMASGTATTSRSGCGPRSREENYANGLPDGELPRGMPNLGLSERTIGDLVAYLETLGQGRRRNPGGDGGGVSHGDHRRTSCPHQW